MNRSAAIALLSLVVATCAPTPPPTPAPSTARSFSPIATKSPAPVAVQAPTPPQASSPGVTPTRSAGVSGWPYRGILGTPVFGPGGVAYLLSGGRDGMGESLPGVVALDSAGKVVPGWPVEEPVGSEFGQPVLGPEGSIYLDECGRQAGCLLHRLDATGQELPGWPVVLPPAFACPPRVGCLHSVDIGADGTAYVSHWREVGGLQVIAIDRRGGILSGWPVVPDGNGVWWSDAKVGSNGTLFMLRRPDGGESPASLGAFGTDGHPRSGWPVEVPDAITYILGPNGTVVVRSSIDDQGELCSEPSRTVFTALSPDGGVLPGWPRGSKGLASDPAVGADGTVYYVSALGNLYAHDAFGEVKPGWPVPVPGAALATGCGPIGPYLAPDGSVFVLADEVTARAADGRSLPGWPYRPSGLLYLYTGDSEGGANRPAPAFGSDGVTYVAVFGRASPSRLAEIVALDRGGHLQAGWPYRLPIDVSPNWPLSLAVSPDGRLYVSATDQRQGGGVLWALDPDGNVSD